jgi:hypothetical protein
MKTLIAGATMALMSIAAAGQSLGNVARQVRKQRAAAPRPVAVYTNDNLPKVGMISETGAPAAPAAQAAKPSAAAEISPADDKKLEADWRQKFATARERLALDQQTLDVDQREFNLASVQYYSNPNEALQQQYTRSELTERQQRIEEDKKKVAADQATIAELQDQLAKAGLPPGWGRP